ncbi:MAG: hypothetical protein WAV73_04805 [Candidatus Moraniibacteriota bacterium]
MPETKIEAIATDTSDPIIDRNSTSTFAEIFQYPVASFTLTDKPEVTKMALDLRTANNENKVSADKHTLPVKYNGAATDIITATRLKITGTADVGLSNDTMRFKAAIPGEMVKTMPAESVFGLRGFDLTSSGNAKDLSVPMDVKLDSYFSDTPTCHFPMQTSSTISGA